MFYSISENPDENNKQNAVMDLYVLKNVKRKQWDCQANLSVCVFIVQTCAILPKYPLKPISQQTITGTK